MRDKCSWMTLIRPRSRIRRDGMLARIARPASPSRMGHRRWVERGMSASGRAVSSPRITDPLALVEQRVVLPVYSSTLHSQVYFSAFTPASLPLTFWLEPQGHQSRLGILK